MQLTALLKVLVRFAPLIVLAAISRPLTFRPAPGSTVTKHLSSEWDMHLDKMEIVVDGRAWWTGITMDTELSQRITVIDTYLALEGGQPAALDRKFDAISQDLEIFLGGGLRSPTWESVTGTSELEGAIVEFRREDGGYEARFDPLHRDLEDELLGGLTEDMDLRVLLPTETPAVGDEWDIDLASISDLVSPGGYFAWTIESGGTVRLLSDALDPALMGELRHVIGAMLDGHATVQYTGEERGLSQLDILIKVEGTKGVNELTALATKIVEEFPDWGTIEVVRFDLEFALGATGTAQWDTKRGRIFDLALKGDVESAMDLEIAWDLGSEFLIEVRTAVAGDFEQRFETE